MASTSLDGRRADELDSDVRALLDELDEVGAPDISQLSPEQIRTVLGDLFTPATLFTCGYDPLRHEQFAYGEALADAGVPVEHTNYDDTIHDFANMSELAEPFPNVEAANDVQERAAEALREAFE